MPLPPDVLNLLRWRLLDRPVGQLGWSAKVIEAYAGLSPERRAQLARHAERLEGVWLQRQGTPLARPLAMSAALVPGLTRGKDPVEMLEARTDGMSAAWIDEAAAWVMTLSDVISRATAVGLLEGSAPEDFIDSLRALAGRAHERDDEALFERYRSLTPPELGEVVATVLALAEPGTLEYALREVAALTDAPLTEVHGTLLDRGILWPAELYRAPASKDTLAKLAVLASHPAHPEVHHARTALAWAADDEAVALFSAIPEPSGYTHEAGWELESGTRRRLIPEVCRRLVPGRSEANGAAGECPWCGRHLVTVLVLERDDLVPLGLEGFERLSFRTCGHCVVWSDVHVEFDASGVAQWSAENVRLAELPGNPEGLQVARPFVPAEPKRPLEARVRRDGRAQLGGMPAWEQHAAFPRCRRCSRSMPFLAQLAELESAEGTLYAFVCASCRTGATVYQQT